VGDFLLVVLTVLSVGFGGYFLGRASMREVVTVLQERCAFYLDELDAVVEDQLADLRDRRNHPALRIVPNEQP
jgi:hypothetical protein